MLGSNSKRTPKRSSVRTGGEQAFCGEHVKDHSGCIGHWSCASSVGFAEILGEPIKCDAGWVYDRGGSRLTG
uniref:Uncharacterized protein n=1 Tax=Arundo donax TaxID=35708 RepID=A0A0A9A6G7_ARUDO